MICKDHAAKSGLRASLTASNSIADSDLWRLIYGFGVAVHVTMHVCLCLVQHPKCTHAHIHTCTHDACTHTGLTHQPPTSSYVIHIHHCYCPIPFEVVQ